MKLKFKQSKKPVKINFFHPVKLNTSRSVRKVSMRNLTWPQASVRFPRLNPFGDSDRDGKLNMFDCHPFDKKRHSAVFRDEITQRLFLQEGDKQGSYKELNKLSKKLIIPKAKKDLQERYISGRWKEDFANSRAVTQVDYNSTEGKVKADKFLKRNYKLVTPIDIVKHVEKHPELLKTLEKTQIAILNPRKFGRTKAITTEENDILLRSSYPNKENIGEVLEHEIAHVEQGKRLRIKLRGDIKEWSKKSDKLSIDEYNETPIEADAEERRIKKRKEWESYKQEKPETLQSLKEDLKEDLRD